MSLFLQIFIIICFIIIIIALFREKTDFLAYSVASTLAAATATYLFSPTPIHLEDFFFEVDWSVIFFLISMFTIVAILEDKRIFNEIALRITKKFSTNTRKFFWVICLISTISAAFIEDVSVAIIFIPMIISTSEKMRINPTPILLGVTICINLAATLTPFGSAQNVLIANEFFLTTNWFFISLGIFFVVAVLTTLFLLDQFFLKKHLKDIWVPHCVEYEEPVEEKHLEEHELVIMEDPISLRVFYKNLIALLGFFLLLILIPNIVFVGVFGMLIFVFINPRRKESGRKQPDISHYLKEVDFKLIFFFICLFILVYCFEVAGIIGIINDFINLLAPTNIFLLSILILVLTSILSGFLCRIIATPKLCKGDPLWCRCPSGRIFS